MCLKYLLGEGVALADRFCGNCGHELRSDDRFCPSCGRAVHKVAHVPTSETDVSVPPPLQGTQGTSDPTGAQRSWLWKWWPFAAILLVFVLLAAIVGGSGGGSSGGGGGEDSEPSSKQPPERAESSDRLLGKKPSLLQVVFGRLLTIVMVILVIVSGFSYFQFLFTRVRGSGLRTFGTLLSLSAWERW